MSWWAAEPDGDVTVLAFTIALPVALALLGGLGLHQRAWSLVNGVLLAGAIGYLGLLVVGSSTQG